MPQKELVFIQALLTDDDAKIKELAKDTSNDPVVTEDPVIHLAAFVGNTVALSSLYDSFPYADWNAKDGYGRTPLHLACGRRKPKVVEFLLSRRVDLTAVSENGQSALHYAAWSGSTECLEILLGCEYFTSNLIDVPDNHGRTPLHIAVYYGQIDVMKRLLQISDKYAKDIVGRTVSHWACACDRSCSFDLLLVTNSFDATSEDNNGRTPLHYAALNGNADIVFAFLQQFPTLVNSKDAEGCTALHYAVLKGADKVISVLLSLGASPNCVSLNGMAPIHYAVSLASSIKPLILLLRETNTLLSVSLPDRRNALHIACEWGKKKEAELLLTAGLLVDSESINNASALHFAAFAGQTDVASTLILYNATVDWKMKGDLTPLHIAAYMGHVSLVKLLLERGADPNLADSSGRTTLMLAAYGKSFHANAVVNLLVEFDVEINATCNVNATALHYAAIRGNIPTLAVLISKGADISVVDKYGRGFVHILSRTSKKIDTAILPPPNEPVMRERDVNGFSPIHYAAHAGNTTIASHYWQNEDVELMSSSFPFYYSPLHLAAKAGHANIIKIILSRVPKENVSKCLSMTDHRMRLPLHYAMKCGSLECVKRLLDPELLSSDDMSVFANWTDKNDNTPLHFAAASGKWQCLLYAVKAIESCPINRRDNKRRTCAMLLMSSGAVLPSTFPRDIQWKLVDENRRGALMRAVSSGKSDMIPSLLKYNCSATQCDANGVTPLHVACRVSDKLGVELLLEAGADCFAKDLWSFTPLDYAAAAGNLVILELLYAQFNGSWFVSSASMLMAAQEGSFDCLVFFNSIDSDVARTAKDPNGRTCLHLSAMHGHYECLEYLVDNGSDLDTVDIDGRTALMYAAMEARNVNSLDLLLHRGADVSLRDAADGNSALHLACLANNDEAAKIICKHLSTFEDGIETIEAVNKKSETALHIAVRLGIRDVVFQLLSMSHGQLFIQDSLGRMPVAAAVEQSDVLVCVNLVLQRMLASIESADSTLTSFVNNDDKSNSFISNRSFHATQENEFY